MQFANMNLANLTRGVPLPAEAPARPGPAVLARVARWAGRLRQRRHLLALDERMLRDIGLTRDDVRREARKFFWQV